MVDSALISFLQWLIPTIVVSASSFVGVKIGLKQLSEKVDNIDKKIEKISEAQTKADKDMVLVEYRLKTVEENLKKQESEKESFVENIIARAHDSSHGRAYYKETGKQRSQDDEE